MEAALSQLSLHHAELALRMVVGAGLGGLYGLRKRPQQHPSASREGDEGGGDMSKECDS